MMMQWADISTAPGHLTLGAIRSWDAKEDFSHIDIHNILRTDLSPSGVWDGARNIAPPYPELLQLSSFLILLLPGYLKEEGDGCRRGSWKRGWKDNTG